jgi:hypothetical protein
MKGRNQGRGSNLPRGNRNCVESRPSNNEISVPILTWSTNFTQNNLRIWKEQMENFAMNKYGHFGLLFQTNEYYIPEEIEYPSNLDDGSDPLSQENDPGGFLADDYRSQIKTRREHIKKMEMDRLPLYAFMYSKLSPQSKTALMRELMNQRMFWRFGYQFKRHT